jgi:hypothetical protein
MTPPPKFVPAVAELVVSDFLPPMGPGTPNQNIYAKLKSLRAESAFAPYPVCDHDMAACCLSGLWLLHGYLDESHKLSQEIETASGSYWHGLMHRREPDFGNSKYWFRRVGTHAIFPALCNQAARVAAGAPRQAAFLAHQTTWDPMAFVDLCEESYDESASCHMLCRRVQRAEWNLLFGDCYQRALGI